MHAVERKVLLVKPIHEEAIYLKTITDKNILDDSY